MDNTKQWSYWEERFFMHDIDLLVVGAGFTGLAAAIRAKELNPKWKVVVLERDMLGEGASTKNAGFACYGTVGEFLDDEREMGRDKALELILKRRQGLEFLQKRVSPQEMGLQSNGGLEIFLKGESKAWERALEAREDLNKDLGHDLYQESKLHKGFQNTIGSIYTPDEASLDPVELWQALRKKAILLDIIILHKVEVMTHQSHRNGVSVQSTAGDWRTRNLLYCTNAFGLANQPLDLVPARNQVLVLKHPIFRLKKMTYHQHAGYLYFRPVNELILLGGARHISPRAEISRELLRNEKIEQYLMQYARNLFSDDDQWEIVAQWSGIIATGTSKEPIVQEVEPQVYACLRFGGMGVALSTFTANKAVERFFS